MDFPAIDDDGPSLTPLSESARRARRPAPPAILMDASQERPVASAKARVAVAVRALKTAGEGLKPST